MDECEVAEKNLLIAASWRKASYHDGKIYKINVKIMKGDFARWKVIFWFLSFGEKF